MKKTLWISLLFLTGCQSIPEVRQSLTSGAGHQVLYRHMAKAKGVAVIVEWPSDWAMKTDANPAAAHLGSQVMVVGGTASSSAAEVAERFSELGVEGYVVPRLHTVRGVVNASQKDLADAAKLANQVLLEPTFDPRWVKRVANDRQARQEEAFARSGAKAWQALAYMTIEDDRARQFYLMDDASLFSSVNQEQMQQWHRQTFSSAGPVIAVAGKLSAQEALTAVDHLLQGLPSVEASKGEPLSTNFSKREVLLHLPSAEKSTLTFAGELPDLQGTGSADILASMILGQGPQSRLNKAIRDELRASYGFSASVTAYDRTSRFVYLAGEIDSTKLSQAREAAAKAYDDFVREGPSEAEFRAARTNFLNHIKQASGQSARLAAAELLDYAEMGWELDDKNRTKEELEAMTRDSFTTYLKDNWPTADRFITLVVSAEQDVLPGACIISEPAQAQACP